MITIHYYTPANMIFMTLLYLPYYYHQYSIIKDLSPRHPKWPRHEGLAPLRHQGLVAAVLLPVGTHLDGSGAERKTWKTQKCQKTWSNHGKNMVKSW